MTASFRFSVILVLFLTVFTGLNARSLQVAQPNAATSYVTTPINLQVTQTSPTSVSLQWEEAGSASSYTVTVRNLTTGQVEKTFQTSNTSAIAGSLKINNTYRFEVKENGFIIVDTLEM